MKKVFLPILILFLGLGFNSKVSAQKYFVYDGDTFNVLFTCNDSNTIVTDVEFSYSGAWVKFDLVGKTNLEDTKAGGFIFYCKDGKGDYYAIDYYRTDDYVIVHACNTDLTFKDTQWTLHHRADKTEVQKYFVYDGDTFNIMFTCNSDNSKVTDVEFSNNGKWVKFELVDKADLETTEGGGFLFYCKDGKGDYYGVDYYRDDDYVIVHACNTDLTFKDTSWRLHRRKE
jgi:hypothetical protein